MTTFEVAIAIATGLYLSQVILFLVGLSKHRDTEVNDLRPFVSVIIAARDEEGNLSNCLESVAAQTYPSALFEVIVVNDDSTDGTQDICDEFHSKYSTFRSIMAKEIRSFPGKTGALIQGIEASKGEIIFVTDADCTVPPSWIESTIRRYTPDVGIVGGMTLQSSTNAFQGMQSLDWAYLLGIASAAVSLRNPLSTIGNNLSFRRTAYDSVGGYRGLPFSITEDYTLFQAIVQTGHWEYYYPLDPDILVVSKPCTRITELIRQKHRWARGGLDMRLSGLLIMAVGFLFHLGLVGSLVAGNISLGLLMLLAKFLADYFLLATVLRLVNKAGELRFFYWFELYFVLYVLALPLLVAFGGKVIWKERSY